MLRQAVALGVVVAGGGHAPMMRLTRGTPARGPILQGGQALALALAEGQLQVYASFAQVVDLIREKRDAKLLIDIETGLRLVKYAPGRIEFEPAPGAAADLASRLGQRLQLWTGARWGVSVVSSGGQPTIAEEQDKGRIAAEAEAMGNPLVMAVLAAFPGARIAAIRTPEALAAAAALDALPEVPEVNDEWDPFEDE